MAETAEQKITFQTKGIQSVYCNHANVSLSYSDIRVYLGELSPGELVLIPTGNDFTRKDPLFEPKFSLVLSPEFARQLAKAITIGTEQYEALFGSLRPEVSQEQLDKSLQEGKK